MELLHGCHLEVIHTPGDVLIAKGTDGVSRHTRNTELQVTCTFPVAELFEPFPLSPSLIGWAYQQAGGLEPPNTRLFHDLDNWSKGLMVKHDCVWSVSPTMAPQAFSTAALAWVKSPLDSSHLFSVPRVMQRDLVPVNKHIRYLGQYDHKELALKAYPFRVPLLLFYLPCHHRALASPDLQQMDLSSFPHILAWVTWQVSYMHALS
jgi:hypothetical protein